MPRVFISHDTAEQQIAEVFRRELPGAEVFVAGADILPGTRWRERIDDGLAQADAYLLVATERAVGSHWVWVEYGQALRLDRRIIPVILPGARPEDLPAILLGHQCADLQAPEACARLASSLGVNLSDGGRALFHALETASAWTRVRPGHGLPARSEGSFLVDASHGQEKWPRSGQNAWFLDGLDPMRRPIRIRRPVQLHRGHLSDWPGLVMASPYRAQISDELQREVVAWVHEGGRLLLLGYELGDRHHGANLNALARHFGIHFRADILAPAGTATGSVDKPYGEPIIVHPTPAHEGVAACGPIELVNVQSIDVDPGGQVLIGAGDCPICEPDPETVEYSDGVFSGGGVRFTSRGPAPWLGVLVRAPRGLTGKGQVLALGTWKVPTKPAGNSLLLRLLAAWLGGA